MVGDLSSLRLGAAPGHQPSPYTRLVNRTQLCAEVAADALATRLRIEALRIAERLPGPTTEHFAREAVDRRMEELVAWSADSFGAHQPAAIRIGYSPPWKPDVDGLFGTGTSWVELQTPWHLHPLPDHHRAVRPYLERSARSLHKLPGIRPVPAEVLETFEGAYRAARVSQEQQAPVLREATEAHRSVRRALLRAFRNRARVTGEPVRLIPFARLLLVEADAAEAAWEVLSSWLSAECDSSWWTSIPGLGAAHRFPPPA